MSRYLQSLKSQIIVFLHQMKSRDNGPVLLFEILAIIVGIDTVSCLLLLNRLTQQRVTSNGIKIQEVKKINK